MHNDAVGGGKEKGPATAAMAGEESPFPLLSLPDEAIEVVFSCLDLLSHVRLAAACAALHSLAAASPIAKRPLLLSPLADAALAQPLLRRFLSPLLRPENGLRDVRLIVVGSLRGWLVVVQDGFHYHSKISLFHGVLRREDEIPLKGSDFGSRDVDKVTLSTDPDAKACVVAVLWGARRNVSVCRPSSKDWRTAWEAVGTTSIHDMAFHRKQLWLACSDGSLYVLDIDKSSITSVKSSLQLPRHWGDVYLLAAAGKLLVLHNVFSVLLAHGMGHALARLGDPDIPDHRIEVSGWWRSTARPTLLHVCQSPSPGVSEEGLDLRQHRSFALLLLLEGRRVPTCRSI